MASIQKQHSMIRCLAEKVAEIAASPSNAAIQQRWRDVNALRKPDRAPVWCRPVGAWRELLPESSFECTHPWLRSLETTFKQILLKHEIGDDSPVSQTLDVPVEFDIHPQNIWGLDIVHQSTGDEGGAWLYDPQLRHDEDFDRLQMPVFTYNRDRTQENLNRAHDLLGDLLPIRQVCHAPLTATLGTPAADLRGLTPFMLDMVSAPNRAHQLMGYLRDAVLGAMAQVEATGLLTPNHEGPMTCSDDLGTQAAGNPAGYANMWVMTNSQEFEGVSPSMWREFCLEYQRPIIEQFGLCGYGCCENLTRKIEGVLSLRNLRIFVCSAWTDLSTVQDAVGQNYVIMWRQKASDVVFPDSLETIRQDLEQGCRQLKGYYYQIVLRELQTLHGHPRRLHDWTRTAIEIAEKYG